LGYPTVINLNVLPLQSMGFNHKWRKKCAYENAMLLISPTVKKKSGKIC
jgi:hypothetical protein